MGSDGTSQCSTQWSQIWSRLLENPCGGVFMAKLFIDRVVERGADRSVALAEIGQSNYSCRLSGD